VVFRQPSIFRPLHDIFDTLLGFSEAGRSGWAHAPTGPYDACVPDFNWLKIVSNLPSSLGLLLSLSILLVYSTLLESHA
jgi:hypothetical protein